MQAVERHLLDAGCPKINLQIRADNVDAVAFYEALGFGRDEVVSYERLIEDRDVS